MVAVSAGFDYHGLFMLRGQGILQMMAGKDADQMVGQAATKRTGTADRMAGAIEDGGGAIGDGLPQLALRHSPEALRWVRRQRGWSKAELARTSGLSVSTIRGLENGTRSAGALTLAKLAEALECPQMVLEARQISAVATSALSALDLLERLLQIGEPAHLTRRRGYVRLGFIASGRHIGTLRMQEGHFDELVNALRCHFPHRHGPTKTLHHPVNDTTSR